jgi:hypothetical protein
MTTKILNEHSGDNLENLEDMASTNPSPEIAYLLREAARGSRKGFERFLAAVPDVPPEPNDALP